MTPEQDQTLKFIAAWADKYPCIKAMYIFGSFARDETKPTSDLDIAFEYVADVHASDHDFSDCYTMVNAEWDNFADELRQKVGHQPHPTGLSPFHDKYDHIAWGAIRKGKEIGRCGKAILTWAARKPTVSEGCVRIDK